MNSAKAPHTPGYPCLSETRIPKWDGGGLSLAGLSGGGSIPLAMAGLGGLLSLLGLIGLKVFEVLPHKPGDKEVPMERTVKPMQRKLLSRMRYRIKEATVSTIWAIGTGMASGTLSG